jgi:hypothetical protein
MSAPLVGCRPLTLDTGTGSLSSPAPAGWCAAMRGDTVAPSTDDHGHGSARRAGAQPPTPL